MRPLGLYIHVPFCARKCAYCDFPSHAGSMALRGPYVERLCAEIAGRAEALQHPRADTVFIGGGTPSLLMPRQISRILQAVRTAFPLADGFEWSCEANPGMLSDAFLAALRAGGVNRLSLGAQSADPALLQTLGRQHSWAQVEEAVARSRAAGFQNINIDLMLGIPGQDLASWQRTLEAALRLQPQHLSCYGLIVEEGTPLAAAIGAGSLSLPPEEEELAMYGHTLHRLKQAGFEHYEVSNFALPGFRCRHNLHCWQRENYLGFGSAAHSLEGGSLRRQNPMGIAEYLRGDAPEQGNLSPEESRFESLMLGLRLIEGLDLQAFRRMHGISFEEAFLEQAQASIRAGLSAYEPPARFRLTEEGLGLMNRVLLDFMQPEKLS